jgi:hypothetical protein
MRYLGGISGTGMLTCKGEDIAPAVYDFEGFSRRKDEVTGSGEIKLDASCLQTLFGRSDVWLRTEDGRLLELRFSDRSMREPGVAHVDLIGDLPPAQDWRR